MARARRLGEVAPPVARRMLMRPGRVRRVPIGLAEGLRFEVGRADPVHPYLGTAEVEIARHVRRLARPGCRCFDIGGHNAYYAMILVRLTGEQVVSFDFTSEAIRRMARNLELNPSVAPLVSLKQAYIAHESNPKRERFHARRDRRHRKPLAPGPDQDRCGRRRGDGPARRARRLGAPPPSDHRDPRLEVEQECLRLLAELHYSLTVVGPRRWFAEHRLPHNRWVIAEAS